MQRAAELFTEDEKITKIITAVLEAIYDLSSLDLAEIKLFYLHFFEEEQSISNLEKLPPKLGFILRKFIQCCTALSETADADEVLAFIIEAMPDDSYLLSNEVLSKIDILSQYCGTNLYSYLLVTIYSAIKIAKDEYQKKNSVIDLIENEKTTTLLLHKKIEAEYQKIIKSSLSPTAPATSAANTTLTNTIFSFFCPTKPLIQENKFQPSGDTAYVRNVPSMTFSKTGAETSPP